MESSTTYGDGLFAVGGNGMSTCTSEAQGMMLDYAVDTQDAELFGKLANGY